MAIQKKIQGGLIDISKHVVLLSEHKAETFCQQIFHCNCEDWRASKHPVSMATKNDKKQTAT